MNKIRIFILLLIIFFLSLAPVFAKTSTALSESAQNCVKGDKILNYYESLQDKTDADKYLIAAKYFYFQAQRSDLSNPNAFIGRARVFLYQDNILEAKNALMTALNFNEKNPRVNFYLGETFYQDGEYKDAIDYYTKAYNYGYKYDYKTNIQLGTCYQKLGYTEKARLYLKNALKIKPASIDAQAKLGALDAINTQYENYPVFSDSTVDSQNEEVSPEDLKILNNI